MVRAKKKPAVQRKPEATTQVASRSECGRRSVRGKRGGLRDMPTMPLDVLLEIFSYLEPRDLLNLARTTKPFRAFLMDRGSANMWKATRANVEGLPDCPPHLSEPAYANLVFFSYCHNCLKPNVQTIYWEFNKRYCPPCAKILTMAKWKEIHCKPQNSWSFSYGFDRMFSTVRVNGRDVYHCSEFDTIKPIWEKLRNTDDWAVFMSEQKMRVQAIREHAFLCRDWDKKRATKRSAELHEIRRQRFDTIVSKLRDLGWGEELDRMPQHDYYPLSGHVDVRPSKRLTDRAWAKIQTTLIAFMEETKEERLRAERRIVVHGRLNALRSVISAARIAPPKRTIEDEYKPKFQDLVMMPEFRELIDGPTDAVVDEQALAASTPMGMLHVLEERWQRERRAELRALAGDPAAVQNGVDVLDLALTMFRCKRCQLHMHHPAVLAHECPVLPLTLMGNVVEIHGMDRMLSLLAKITNRLPWSVSDIRLASCSDQINMVIRICEKDPKLTTHKELDNANIRLVYEEPALGAVLMTWRRAITYMINEQSRTHDRSRWRLATDEDREAVKAREADSMVPTPHIGFDSRQWRCGWCDVLQQPKSSWTNIHKLGMLQTHVRDLHAVQNPTMDDGDFYLHPDSKSEPLPIRIKDYGHVDDSWDYETSESVYDL